MEKKWKYPVTKPAPQSGMKAQAEEGQSHTDALQGDCKGKGAPAVPPQHLTLSPR